MPLTDVVPLQLADAGAAGTATATATSGERDYKLVTQFSMKPVEELGLLKMDFLGLRNLDVIEDALDIIERSSGRAPGHVARCRSTTRRPTRCSPAATRSASSSSSPRACRAPCARSGRRSSTTSSRSSRCTARAPWTRSPTYARGKRNPDAVSVPDERLEPIIGPTYGRDPVPGAGDADLQGPGRLQRRQGRRPAQGDRQEEPRRDGEARARVPRRLPPVGHVGAGHRLAVDHEREVGRLLVQQVATPPATR